jgi:hypothetical protein
VTEQVGWCSGTRFETSVGGDSSSHDATTIGIDSLLFESQLSQSSFCTFATPNIPSRLWHNNHVARNTAFWPAVPLQILGSCNSTSLHRHGVHNHPAQCSSHTADKDIKSCGPDYVLRSLHRRVTAPTAWIRHILEVLFSSPPHFIPHQYSHRDLYRDINHPFLYLTSPNPTSLHYGYSGVSRQNSR